MGFFGGGGGGAASNMGGATSSAAGTAGLVPAPAAGSHKNFLRGDATFQSLGNLIPATKISRGSTYLSWFGGYNVLGATSNIINSSGGYVLFSPIYVRESKSYTTYWIYVTTAGSANSLGKMALYSIKGSDATPDAVICQSGTFAASSTGLKQPTMSSTFVEAGWYYMAVGTDSTSNLGFQGDTMSVARAFLAGQAPTAALDLLDFSQKLYADLWPNPWNGTGTTWRNAYHFISDLT
jgi:hypothetical protein